MAGGCAAPLYASFWVIVTQIVVLDAVFSLDSVITAVGMVDHLAIMMIAVIIAIGIMLLASSRSPASSTRIPPWWCCAWASC